MRPLLVIVFFMMAGCRQYQPSDTAFAEGTSTQSTDVSPNAGGNVIDSIGKLEREIEFVVKASKDELEIYPDGVIPYISLDDANKYIKRLINADEIVIPYSRVSVFIDYPLEKPAIITLMASNKGFSRKELVQKISKAYHEIYKEEELSAKQKTIPIKDRKTLANRNQTDGKYGIWGHDLADLVLSTIQVHKNASGRIMLLLDIES